MSSLSSKLALGAALGAAVAGCQATGISSAPAHGQAASASRSPAVQTSLAKSVVSRSSATATATASATATATATASAASAVADVGVVADCAGPAPLRLSSKPSSIILACADSGIGIQDLDWTAWTATAATGSGLLWENLCDPSCADGAYSHFPVTVTLSTVKDSARGTWFSRLAVTWQGNRPDNQTPDNFTLMPPTS